MKRRTLLKGGLAALALAGANYTGLSLLGKPGFIDAARADGFTVPLPIPPLLEDLDNTADSARFIMNVQQGSIDFGRLIANNLDNIKILSQARAGELTFLIEQIPFGN